MTSRLCRREPRSIDLRGDDGGRRSPSRCEERGLTCVEARVTPRPRKDRLAMSAYGGTRTMYQARSAFDPSINKQIICRHIAAGRVCAAGATCVFAHTEAELRGPLRDLFLHCENAAPQHIERLAPRASTA